MIRIITDVRREHGDYNSGETLIFNDATSIRLDICLRATADMGIFGGEENMRGRDL